MGTLGQYLRSAREAKDIDIRDAAQQTRISIAYLNALEAEDFSKLPGEVFVKGFLKNYARFLKLDEAEALRRYAELKPQPQAPAAQQTAATATVDAEKTPASENESRRRETPIEPFIWGAVILISLLFFLFTSFPLKGGKTREDAQSVSLPSAIPAIGQSASDTAEKLYLEIVAVEDTWLLVRTDTSPQKKAVLKKGESLIWSANDRFLVSYGRVGDVKLLLNGEELTVNGTRETPVRDLAITRTGILNQPAPAKQPLPVKAKQKPQTQVQEVRGAQPARKTTPAVAPLRVSGHDQATKHPSDQAVTGPASSSSTPPAVAPSAPVSSDSARTPETQKTTEAIPAAPPAAPPAAAPASTQPAQ